ncbi:uncharacterized protein LOC117173852 [Belonocnema kinseyi]|uniref:uncharacterized protein LOC117173852 n=1 Tax=Belonocnema kinseyi TaxID=2817044 RepID=UPI00143D7BDB|nr:uncharacterized protein LOC117173852 [Belonocnema kinseyi]
MYADDLLLYVTGILGREASELLKLACKQLTPRLERLGLSILTPKSQLCVFSRGRGGGRGISIRINGTVVRSQCTLNYLGIILDQKMNCIAHIRAIAAKASRALNILRVIARISWGALPSLLLTVHRGLSRVCLEWGAPLFFRARATALRMLDTIHHASLRVALGCMSSTPISVLPSEAAETPLSLRRSLLVNRFILRNFCWNASLLARKLEDLTTDACTRGFRVNPEKVVLLAAYGAMGAFIGALDCSERPGYFDDSWGESRDYLGFHGWIGGPELGGGWMWILHLLRKP